MRAAYRGLDGMGTGQSRQCESRRSPADADGCSAPMRRPWRPLSKQVRPPLVTKSAARFDPKRKPPVRRSIRDNVGNSRPATAPDPLLDHLVGGGQQRLWDREAERLGGFEVYDHLKFCRELHREIGRLLAA